MILNCTATILEVIRIPPTPDIALETGSSDIHHLYCNVAWTAYDLTLCIPIPFPFCNIALQSSCIHAISHECATYHFESVSPISKAITISPMFYATTHNKICKSLVDNFEFVSFSHSVCKFMPSVLFCFVVHSLCKSDDCLRLISKCGGRLSVCVKYLAHSVCLPC